MPKVTVGLDIGFSTIKVVALSHEGNAPKLVSLGMIASPQPGMVSESDIDLEAVAASIKKLLTAAKIDTKEIVTALPESKVFTRIIDDLPYLSDNELPSAIKYASEEFIPMPLSEVSLNWQVLARFDGRSYQRASSKVSSHLPLAQLFNSSQTKVNPAVPIQGVKTRTVVFVVASPKNVINKYMKVLNMAGFKPKALETEIIASTRALVGTNTFSPSTLTIQMGSATTDFAVVSKGLIWLTRSISTGGLALTRVVAQNFNFELLQAEEYKKVYGLLEDQLEGKVFQALKPIVDVVAGEAKRVIQAFEAKYPSDPIKRVILSGGGAKTPGLVIYFANNLGLEVQEADPWYLVSKDKNLIGKLAAEAPLYSVAVGLALREE